MSPLARFQRATIFIAAGDRVSGATELHMAITAIDRTGRDFRIRAHLAELLEVVERKPGPPQTSSKNFRKERRSFWRKKLGRRRIAGQ
jgi:hypothetical protein